MQHRLSDIKLIVIDIDGTLVNMQGKVGERTKILADKLKEHNIFCTLSSARSFFYSVKIAEELEVNLPIVTLDGGLIKSRNNELVYKGIMGESIIRRAIKAAEENYGKISVCTEDYLYITPRNSVVREYTHLNAPIREVTDYLKVKDVLEILIYCEDKENFMAIRNYFKFPYNLRVYINVTKSPHDYYLITIKKRGSDKLTSIKRLVRYLKFKRGNIATVGDWHNDMPLFDYGAFNFAVQNAIPELKRKADYVTAATNNEDAVGEVLDIVYKNRVLKFETSSSNKE